MAIKETRNTILMELKGAASPSTICRMWPPRRPSV